MGQSESLEKREPTTTRLIFVWLFGGIIEWIIQHFNQWLSPTTASVNLPFEAAFGHACAAIFFLLKWPEMFSASRMHPRLADLAIGTPTGYLMANIAAIMVGRSNFEGGWIWTNPHRQLAFISAVLIFPAAEELIYRGAILSSLMDRTSAPWAVLITTMAATVMHDTWRVAFPNQLLLCAVYFVCRRSLPASAIAHVVANAFVFAPGLLIGFYMK